jgi:zinc transport system substrate-binding protein
MKICRLKLCILLLLVSVILMLLPACTPVETAGSDRLVVAVSVLPQLELVQAVGGEKVEVVVMVPTGADPHTYEVKPDQMVLLSKAVMYAKVGSGLQFELVWMDKLAKMNSRMLIVDCASGIQLEEMSHEHEDHVGEMDPHIWLSVKNAKVMVRNICSGLVEIDPGNTAFYEKNRDSYLDELTQIDLDLEQSLAGLHNRTFIVFHPAFGYFARDYGLRQVAIEQNGKEPTADYIVRLINEARAANIKVVFVSAQFNSRSAEIIASEICGRVAMIDPLASDYIANMRSIEQAFKGAME